MIGRELICLHCGQPFEASEYADEDHSVCADCVRKEWEEGEADLPDERE